MTRTWWAIQHSCETEGEMIDREYPTLHWRGEGPNDPPNRGPHPRDVFVCDACGQEYAFVMAGQGQAA